MNATKFPIRYPENLPLKEQIAASGYKIGALAKRVGISRTLFSRIINGHDKGERVVKELKELLQQD